MAYRRRYFPFLSIPTNEIQDLAITTGKIADAGVTGPKIANGSVDSDALAANACTPPKIPDGSITGPKIASATIDTSKITWVPLTRPLSTPIVTDEIADGAVTAAKLAAGGISGATLADRSVDGVKLILDTVTGAEIAAGAIDTPELADDAVGNAELQDNAVALINMQDNSVDTAELVDGAVDSDKLATLAVGTIHLQDDAVTAAKLDPDSIEARHLLSVRSRIATVYDHFTGAAFNPRWAFNGVAGYLNDIGGHYATLRPKLEVDADITMDFNAKTILRILESLPTLITRVALPNSFCVVNVGWFMNATAYAYFRIDTTVDVNIKAVTRNSGAETVTDTGIAAGGLNLWQKLTIEVPDASTIRFWVDDVLKATITTNLPTAQGQPFYYVKALNASSKLLLVDYLFIESNLVPNITP